MKFDPYILEKPKLDNPCPQCEHDRYYHIAGQCYNCDFSGTGWFHFCMTYLGKGNAWGGQEGWYTTEALNAVADALPPEKRPFLRYI